MNDNQNEVKEFLFIGRQNSAMMRTWNIVQYKEMEPLH
jgi:hypothetical protein